MRLFRRRTDKDEDARRQIFRTRTDEWQQVGLSEELNRRNIYRAQGEILVFLLLAAGVIFLFSQRQTLFPGYGTPVRIATVAALLILGWLLARALGQGFGPTLFRRMDPGTAGTVGFVIRLVTIVAVTIIGLRIAGVRAGTLAVGGAFTAVVLGIAAQQPLGNLFAGIVIQGTRPFRVGERVRLLSGLLGGSIEGTVSSLGLFYTTFVDGTERKMVPNSQLLNSAVVPLREAERVELRARFDADVSPSEIQERLAKSITVPVNHPPYISLEEIDRDEVVLRITATPTYSVDRAHLAEEILSVTRRGGHSVEDPGDNRGGDVT